ncbi:MAG: cytochrome c oxidase assembly protein [Motilibacteraceae bacterium]
MPDPRSLPPLDPASALTHWVLDPAVLAVVVAAAVGYLLAVRRVRRGGGTWLPARTGLFLAAGLGSVVLVTSSFLGAYAGRLMWVYATQVSLLLTLVPVLVMAGRPLTLVRAAGGGTRVLDGVLGSRPWRALTSPLVGPLLVPLAITAVFFTPLMADSLRHPWVLALTQLGLLAVGAVLAVPLVGEAGAETSALIAVAVLVGILELILDAIPGLVVRLRTHVLAPAYWTSFPRPWGAHALGDQQHAGAVLWFVADVIDLPFLALLFLRWQRADAREAAAADRALDDADDGTGMTVPWWVAQQRPDSASDSQ